MDWSAAGLIAEVRQLARIPDGDSALSDPEILRLADQEIIGTIAPTLQKINEERWVSSETQPIVVNQQDYRIPSRAQGQNVRNVFLVDSGNNTWRMPYIAPEEQGTFQDNSSLYWPTGFGFTFHRNFIRMLPIPTVTGFSLEIQYFRRPNMLTTVNFYPIDAVTPSGSTTFFDAGSGTVPTSFDAAGATVDIVQAKPGFDWMAADVTPVSIISGFGGTVELNNTDFDAGAQAGDYMCIAEEAPVAQVPADMHPSLRLATAVAVADTLGRTEIRDRLQQRFERAFAVAASSLDARSRGSVPRVINRRSHLRGRARWRWW